MDFCVTCFHTLFLNTKATSAPGLEPTVLDNAYQKQVGLTKLFGTAFKMHRRKINNRDRKG